MIKSLSVVLPVMLLLILSGCSGFKSVINPYEENFKCRTKDDAGKCIDTPSAYKEARFPEANNTDDTTTCTDANGDGIPCHPPASVGNTHHQLTAQDSRYKVLSELLEEPDKPMLEPPKIMRVLMLPYKGENDELFMTRYVYLKLKESQWVLTDISEKPKARQ